MGSVDFTLDDTSYFGRKGKRERPMTRTTETRSKPLGLGWIDCPYPVAAVGLARILESEARVHVGQEAPTEEVPSFIIFGTNGVKSLSEGVEQLRKVNSDAPILVFGLRLDLPLARAALKVGAQGFIHATMQPEQIIRAVKMAVKGEIVAPRELLEYLIAN